MKAFDIYFLLKGASFTLALCVAAIIAGSLLAVAVGVIRSFPAKKNIILLGAQKILGIYVVVIRGTPLMLQLMFSYFGLALVGFNMSPFVAAVICLVSYTGAYGAEIVRGGVGAVPAIQWESAGSLAFTPVKAMYYVIFPQALRTIIPAAVSFLIGLIKDSSLVAVIGFVELSRAGRIVVERTNMPLEVFPIVALLYFIMCYPLSRFALRLESKLKVS